VCSAGEQPPRGDPWWPACPSRRSRSKLGRGPSPPPSEGQRGGVRSSSSPGRAPGTRPAHGGLRAARRGLGAGARLRRLPPGPEPRPLERPRGLRAAPRPAGGRLRARRPGGARAGRHPGAPLGTADPRPRHLPRPGALLARPLREGERAALAVPHAHHAGALGGADLGAALPDGAVAVGAALPRARGAPQAADRLGQAGAHPVGSMAAGSADRRGRGQQLRGSGTARRGAPAHGRGHPPPARRAPVRPAAAADPAHDRAPARGGRTPADAGAAPGRHRYPLAPPRRPGLVWRWRSPGRGVLRHGPLAPPRPAGRAAPLGAGARPARGVPPAGVPVHGSGRPTRRDPLVVRPALGGRGHLRGGETAPRRGDAAPVVGPGHRAHHAGPAGALLPSGTVGGRAAPRLRHPTACRDVVRQAHRDLQRCAGRGAPGDLGRSGFVCVRTRRRGDESAASGARPPNGSRLLRSATGKVELREAPATPDPGGTAFRPRIRRSARGVPMPNASPAQAIGGRHAWILGA
jgi:hypothetical protein